MRIPFLTTVALIASVGLFQPAFATVTDRASVASGRDITKVAVEKEDFDRARHDRALIRHGHDAGNYEHHVITPLPDPQPGPIDNPGGNDSCPTAFNGDCEEGSGCALGTDSTDCGVGDG